MQAQPPGGQKPRTYRKPARKDYLKQKRRKKQAYERIKAVKKQLNYVQRNYKHIEKLIKGLSLECLSNVEYESGGFRNLSPTA